MNCVSLSVDFNEEFSALFGGILEDQKLYLELCIQTVLGLYKASPNPPKSVTIVAHSMVSTNFGTFYPSERSFILLAIYLGRKNRAVGLGESRECEAGEHDCRAGIADRSAGVEYRFLHGLVLQKDEQRVEGASAAERPSDIQHDKHLLQCEQSRSAMGRIGAGREPNARSALFEGHLTDNSRRRQSRFPRPLRSHEVTIQRRALHVDLHAERVAGERPSLVHLVLATSRRSEPIPVQHRRNVASASQNYHQRFRRRQNSTQIESDSLFYCTFSSELLPSFR